MVLLWGKSGASLHCNLRLQTILCHQTQLFSYTNPIVVGEFHLHLYLVIFLLLMCLKRFFSVEKYAESCEEECISWAIAV